MFHLHINIKLDHLSMQIPTKLQKELKNSFHTLIKKEANKGKYIENWTSKHDHESWSMGSPSGAVHVAANARHGRHSGVSIDLKVGSTNDSLTVHPRHRLHLASWMFKALQPPLAVKHAPYTRFVTHLRVRSFDICVLCVVIYNKRKFY